MRVVTHHVAMGQIDLSGLCGEGLSERDHPHHHDLPDRGTHRRASERRIPTVNVEDPWTSTPVTGVKEAEQTHTLFQSSSYTSTFFDPRAPENPETPHVMWTSAWTRACPAKRIGRASSWAWVFHGAHASVARLLLFWPGRESHPGRTMGSLPQRILQAEGTRRQGCTIGQTYLEVGNLIPVDITGEDAA